MTTTPPAMESPRVCPGAPVKPALRRWHAFDMSGPDRFTELRHFYGVTADRMMEPSSTVYGEVLRVAWLFMLDNLRGIASNYMIVDSDETSAEVLSQTGYVRVDDQGVTWWSHPACRFDVRRVDGIDIFLKDWTLMQVFVPMFDYLSATEHDEAALEGIRKKLRSDVVKWIDSQSDPNTAYTQQPLPGVRTLYWSRGISR